MPITTKLNSESYLTDCPQILLEFIKGYIPDVDIVFTLPILDEKAELLRPILLLELRDEKGQAIGMGDVVSSNLRGEEQFLSYWAWWITMDGERKMFEVVQKAQTLKMAFLQNKGELRSAGLMNPKISNFRQISGYPFCGGRQLITFQIMLMWS